METVISAIGIANPQYKRPQLETAELAVAYMNLTPEMSDLLRSVYKGTGIDYRHSVLSDYCKDAGQFEFFPNDSATEFPTTAARMQIYKNEASKLALAAIRNCLQSLKKFNLRDITHLVTVSCTGMYAPGIDIEIVQELGLSSTTKRTVINFMGCYGAFNGIKVADAICKADPNASVLVVCIELCTLHVQKHTNIARIVSNAIFADGAAAVLIQSPQKQKKCFRLSSFHCDLLPQGEREMAWHIDDYGFDMVLTAYVPELIKVGIAEFTEKLLKQTHLDASMIDYYAIHPGGIKILESCEESLNISKEDNRYSYEILRNYGNMSSPTVLFVLKAIWDEIHQKDDKKTIFSCAFGPGLTLESMLLTIHHE